MIRNKLLLILYVLLLPVFVGAKGHDSLSYTNHKEFFLHWDNDIFLFKDYYYTQGAHLFFVHPALRKNPVNHLFVKLKNADNYFGLGVVQEIYTPKDLRDTLANQIDRPYAGTLYFRSFLVSAQPGKKLRLSSQFDLGFLGPLSGAEEAQRIIHEWLDLDSPQGWDFQIKNRPYINYNMILEKGMFEVPGIFDFTGTARSRLGNIHDDLQLGAQLRLGRINHLFKGLNLQNKAYNENHNFEMYVFAAAKGSVVLYNATLMGGIIAPESIHQFSYNEINHLVGELNGGIRFNYKFIGAQGTVIWKTTEFETGEQHGWGTISLFFRFN